MADPIKTNSIPLELPQRDFIRQAARDFVLQMNLVPPQPFEELQRHAGALLRACSMPMEFHDFATVILANEVWRETVAAVPFERRILLLPQCLRNRRECPAQVDEFGILCEECGRCPTGRLQAEAERMGYIVMIAEGTTVVKRLLEQGKVDAVIGVSCLQSLEKSFPHMIADAIPGIAIPLLNSGCNMTSLDESWLREVIKLQSDRLWQKRLDLDQLRDEINCWFDPVTLRKIIPVGQTQCQKIGVEWLAGSGKRWRPLLAVSVYQALDGSYNAPVPIEVQRLAIAVECFHKASLVHDDIEDDDDLRYGESTLHKEYGIPIALNVGDYLLGEGYRQIAMCALSHEQQSRILMAAAAGHCTLAHGQGEELAWIRSPGPLPVDKVIEIFRRKTAPAFEVALNLGAVAGGASHETCGILTEFSQALGIAYQIRDDLQDFFGEADPGDADALRPSIILSLAYAAARGSERQLINSLWQQPTPADRRNITKELRHIVADRGVEENARQLYKYHRSEAIRTLHPLHNSELKGLLFRLVGRILGRA